MCGIGGIISDHRLGLIGSDLLSSFKLLELRGPDNFGLTTINQRVVFAHARLSIIGDSTGDQPIQSKCKRYWMVFNGEIYNYKTLRVEILAHSNLSSLGSSDSEVLLEGFAIWGVNFFKKLRGMYAISIYDVEQNLLYLYRDHFGVKPLYYLLEEGFMTFSSQSDVIASIYRKVRGIPKNVELDAIIESFIFRGSSKALFNGLLEVLPGELICFQGHKQVYKKLIGNPLSVTTESLASKLSETMRLHMISDVPVGFLLSGGVDSTIIGQFGKPYGLTQAFTFKQQGVSDESIHAQRVADILGLDLVGVETEKADIIDWLNCLYMPITDPSAVPILAISKKAKKLGYKVLLSGEGADEVFGGYKKYKLVLILNLLIRLGCRRIISFVVNKMRLRSIFIYKDSIYFYGSSSPISVDELKKLFPNRHIEEIIMPISLKLTGGFNFIKDLTNFEIAKRLNYDLLRRSDMATMAASVECRVPFVDDHIIAVGRSLPYYKKLGLLLFSTKKALRSELNKGLKEVVNRPKTGFEIELLDWLNIFEDKFKIFIEERKIEGLNYDYIIGEYNERTKSVNSKLYILWAWLVVETVTRKYQ
jgi:asparagine synthase (glutamine-hydrolysing)